MAGRGEAAFSFYEKKTERTQSYIMAIITISWRPALATTTKITEEWEVLMCSCELQRASYHSRFNKSIYHVTFHPDRMRSQNPFIF